MYYTVIWKHKGGVVEAQRFDHNALMNELEGGLFKDTRFWDSGDWPRSPGNWNEDEGIILQGAQVVPTIKKSVVQYELSECD